MRTPQHTSLGRELSPRSVPLGKIWSAITSEVGAILSEGSTPTTQPDGATSTSTSAAMITTTVTYDTTIVRTVTVHRTTDTSALRATTCSRSCTLDPLPDPLSETTTNGKHTSLPAIVTGNPSPSARTSSITVGTHQPDTTSPATESPTVSSNHHRNQIIGGLAGAIAALVVIGILICFCLRRRKLRHVEADSISEKGLRPVLAQKWSQLTTKMHPTNQALEASRSSTPDFDGGLIRVSLDHWPRPFAHGESLRESMGPGRLRVMNPDPSRPTTPLPRGSAESNGGFLRPQRSALAAVFLGANRSRANSSAGSTHRGVQVPRISIDPALSSEGVARNAPTPSFRSYPSFSTLPVVEQRPPEDPFLTPPDERLEHPAEVKPRRPTANPLQGAAGAASRTLSHLGSALNPFRSKTIAAESIKSPSRHSISTFSSAGDPFQLDRPSIHEHSGRTGNELERQPAPNWNVYEGT